MPLTAAVFETEANGPVPVLSALISAAVMRLEMVPELLMTLL